MVSSSLKNAPALHALHAPFPSSPVLEIELWLMLPNLVIYPGHNYEFGHKGAHDHPDSMECVGRFSNRALSLSERSTFIPSPLALAVRCSS